MKLDLAAARDATIPDVLPAGGARFQVLFCGINPGLYSAATGWHFARPGNRFWPALHQSGFRIGAIVDKAERVEVGERRRWQADLEDGSISFRAAVFGGAI